MTIADTTMNAPSVAHSQEQQVLSRPLQTKQGQLAGRTVEQVSDETSFRRAIGKEIVQSFRSQIAELEKNKQPGEETQACRSPKERWELLVRIAALKNQKVLNGLDILLNFKLGAGLLKMAEGDGPKLTSPKLDHDLLEVIVDEAPTLWPEYCKKDKTAQSEAAPAPAPLPAAEPVARAQPAAAVRKIAEQPEAAQVKKATCCPSRFTVGIALSIAAIIAGIALCIIGGPLALIPLAIAGGVLGLGGSVALAAVIICKKPEPQKTTLNNDITQMFFSRN